MNQLNSIIIEGDVSHGPQLSKTPQGLYVCDCVIAVNRFYKDSNGEEIKEVSFFDIQSFGELAKVLSQTKEGQGMRVVGRLKQVRWQDQEGKRYSKCIVIAEHIELKPFRKVQ